MTWKSVGIEIPEGASGTYFYTTCPKCSAERTKKNAKCLGANLTRGSWQCHHCGWNGSLAEGEQHGPQIPKKPPFRPSNIPTEISADSANWLRSRGITNEVIARNGVVSGTAWMPQVEEWVNTVQFVYRWKGTIRNIKYRDANKNFRMVANAERLPYGLDDISDASTVIWAEGEIDKLSIEVAGFTNALSVPDGAPSGASKNYASKFEFLDPCYPLLEGKEHILAVDNDEPGLRLQEELARRLGKEYCHIVTWPEGCKDANDVLRKYGPGQLASCIQSATPYPIEGLYDAASQADKVRSLYVSGYRQGVQCYWPEVSELYRPRTGEFTVVTGIPGHGKSSFVDAFVMDLSVRHNWKVAVFSPENWPVEAHIAKLAEIYTGWPFERGYTQRMEEGHLEEVLEWIERRFWWIDPGQDDVTLDAVLEKARVAVRRHGVNAVVIDPWNELDHTREGNLSETEHVSQCLSKIRRFSRNHDVHVWVVAHPTKMVKDKDGTYPVPTPYDIAGSANWRNKADNCLSIWRNLRDDGAPVEIHVQKIRFRECGRIGIARLMFDRKTGRYSSVEQRPPKRQPIYAD